MDSQALDKADSRVTLTGAGSGGTADDSPTPRPDDRTTVCAGKRYWKPSDSFTGEMTTEDFVIEVVAPPMKERHAHG